MNGLENWAIYDRPLDFPDKVVARKFINDDPTEDHYVCDTVAEAIAKLPPGLSFMPPMPGDHKSVVGVWL